MYVLLIFCGSLFYIDDERPSLALRMLYAGTNKAVVGLIVALWMVGVTLKFNGEYLSNSILSLLHIGYCRGDEIPN